MSKMQSLMPHVILLLLAISSVRRVEAFPSRWLDESSNPCWVPLGTEVMSTTSVASNNNIALTFTPAINNNRYIPGQSYIVRVSGTGGSAQLLGSSAGSWAGGSCAQASTVGTGSLGDSRGTWTAPIPGAGDITIGGSRGGNFNYGVSSVVVVLQEGTQPPTAAPSKAPSKEPTDVPTEFPTRQPTESAPTQTPTTSEPTELGDTPPPSGSPTVLPSSRPTSLPTSYPTKLPTKAPTQMLIEWTGPLADTRCINLVNTVDGVNASKAPYAHTIGCILLNVCIDNSGLTALAPSGNGDFYALYQLDAAGVAFAKAEFERLEGEGVVNNINFTIRGYVDHDTQAMYNGETTYNGMALGQVLSTTSVQAGIPGPTLPYPLMPDVNFQATTTIDEDDLETGAIICVAVVAIFAVIVLTLAEYASPAAPRPIHMGAENGAGKNWHENPALKMDGAEGLQV